MSLFCASNLFSLDFWCSVLNLLLKRNIRRLHLHIHYHLHSFLLFGTFVSHLSKCISQLILINLYNLQLNLFIQCFFVSLCLVLPMLQVRLEILSKGTYYCILNSSCSSYSISFCLGIVFTFSCFFDALIILNFKLVCLCILLMFFVVLEGIKHHFDQVTHGFVFHSNYWHGLNTHKFWLLSMCVKYLYNSELQTYSLLFAMSCVVSPSIKQSSFVLLYCESYCLSIQLYHCVLI